MLPRNLLCIVAASCVAHAGAELALSSNFADGSEIPADHRHDVDNISPPLRWSGAHPKTESFVLIVDSEREGKGGFALLLVYAAWFGACGTWTGTGTSSTRGSSASFARQSCWKKKVSMASRHLFCPPCSERVRSRT